MTIPIAQLGVLSEIDVCLTVELGSADLMLRDICTLAVDQVVKLERLVDEPLDLKVNGKLVARGEVVEQGNRFGIRIVEIVGQEAGARPGGKKAA